MNAPRESSRLGIPQIGRALLTRLTTVLLMVISLGAAAILASQAGAAKTGAGMHVYRAERAAISITLKREGRYLRRVRITALVRCTNGKRGKTFLAIIGGPGIRIAPGGRFNMSRYNAHELRVLKGRVEGDVIRGYFRAFHDSSPERGFEPRCGTVVPNSQPIHFTARRGGG